MCDNGIRRRSSVSRLFQKIKRKTSKRRTAALSQTPSQNSLLEDEPPKAAENPSAAAMGQANYITLAIYNCALQSKPGNASGTGESQDEGDGFVQGKLFITDKFLLFDSRSIKVTLKLYLPWNDILAIIPPAIDSAGLGSSSVLLVGLTRKYHLVNFADSQAAHQHLLQAWWPSQPTPLASCGPSLRCGCAGHPLEPRQLAGVTPLEFAQLQQGYQVASRSADCWVLVAPDRRLCLVYKRLQGTLLWFSHPPSPDLLESLAALSLRPPSESPTTVADLCSEVLCWLKCLWFLHLKPLIGNDKHYQLIVLLVLSYHFGTLLHFI